MKKDDEYSFKLNVICAIRNCFSIGCFTILAIIFNHWWIVLFSILFIVNVSEKESTQE